MNEGNLSPKDFERESRQTAPEHRAETIIVKVWLEEVATHDGRTKWRGRITHVPGGEVGYLQKLGDIARFIAPYLRGMGVRYGLRERIKRWLPRLKLFTI